MYPVISTNVESVGYDPVARVLRVRFQHGGTYDYSGVDSSLYEAMLQPHPWRRVGRLVRAHPYRKLG